MRFGRLALFVSWLALGGCSDGISKLASTQQTDATDMSSFPAASNAGATLLSAFFGLDDAIPFLASYRICREFGHQDGMPVIFSKEIDINTLQAGDFQVALADDQTRVPGCVTPAPAEDFGEYRTILTIGDLGSFNNPPISVTIVGNVISRDGQTNFRGTEIPVTPLESGPFLVRAESIPKDQWTLGQEASGLPFGGGDGCPESTQQVIRAIWSGGVTKPGGDEVDGLERQAYRVYVVDGGGFESSVTPFAIADLGDGDNNHKLCLAVTDKAVRVEFPEGLMTDPRDDLNPATSVAVSYQ
ncbi:MAG: hypothetical protein AAF541_13490 [Pseudomonadota bacterium]